ncbi:MAG: C45 family autoproteolytic acyltransferase/hydrolase [Edaphocola sp.]
MRLLKKILKVLGWLLGIVTMLLVVLGIYVWSISDARPPEVRNPQAAQWQRQAIDTTMFAIGRNWIRKNQWGLHEMYVEGSPFERGVVNGKLSREQIVGQETAFTNQIKKMIPSPGYLRFLKYVVGFMNRDITQYIVPEYQQEIYGESLSASDSFQWIGTNYSRLLNYHAAHDIGHAMQNLMLVGCTSFGAWDGKTAGGAMILGRNFDFWVGNDFAKQKIVAFVRPDAGYRMAFVTWGGFIGVVSGMNEKGLTVTINAAKSGIPTGAATPVSLVAREILQYAGNIQQAIAIAHKRKMFVSESFLIGSAADHRSVIVEKTPDTLAVYDPKGDDIQCTNHYQSPYFANQELNKDQMANSASVYREQRLRQLLNQNYPLTPQKAANILRDYKGMGNADIGLGNEKAVNQFIAHHSVIFMPDSLRMWVSTAPWQLGTFVCYDLRKIFALQGLKQDVEVADVSQNIAPDSFMYSIPFQQFLGFRKEKMAFLDHKAVNPLQWTSNNPNYYDAYRLAGDYYCQHHRYDRAISMYQTALTKVIATEWERKSIVAKLYQCKREMERKK